MTGSARLTHTCHCGAVASAPCPNLADMPAAMVAIEAIGWGWYDGVGFACSPACAADAEETAALRQGRADARPQRVQAASALDLFAEAAE